MQRLEKVIQNRTARERLLPLRSPKWEDLRVSMTSTKAQGTKDPAFSVFKTNGSGSTGVFAYSFSASQEQELFFSVQIPHEWKLGTNINAHAHWVSPSGITGAVIWGLEYTISDINEAYGNTSIIKSSAPTGSYVADTHNVTPLGTISMTNKDMSAVMLCRVFRDATASGDSYASTAFLTDIDFHYSSDTPGGSSLEYVK